MYKQYRNAIIAKYREDVKCRLTYVDARAAVECRKRDADGSLSAAKKSVSMYVSELYGDIQVGIR